MTAYDRAREALARGDHDAAGEAMREALAAEPGLENGENFAGWIELSRPDRTAAQLEAAIAHFRRSHEPAAIANLADALVTAERPADAVAALEAIDEPVAHNWLGWYFTAKQPELPRAIAHLEAATTARPHWGVAWSNLAKALDASGELARAGAAFATAIDCGDAHDDTYARDRRLQLELILRSRGELPPPTPATARADSKAADVLAATATTPALAHGRVFAILPTTLPPAGEQPFAIIAVDGRSALFVTERELITPTLARLKVAAAAKQLAVPYEFHALDTAIALRAVLTAQLPNPWWLRADKAELVIAKGDIGVAVRPRAAGGVTIVAPELTLEVPTIDALREALPAIVAAMRRVVEARATFATRAVSAGRVVEALAAILDSDDWRGSGGFDRFPTGGQAYLYNTRAPGVRFAIADDTARCTIRIDEMAWTVRGGDELDRAAILAAARVAVGRLRFEQLGEHEWFRVIAPFGPFAPGAIIELAIDSFDPRGDYRAVTFRGPGGDYSLTDVARECAPIIEAIYDYLVRASSPASP
ncbi:MAG TPA: hypothetical protein VGG28_11260 [Kofleriaceae bacterium]|jgi:tetratricopeptide (TPR) repeat protein